MKIDFEFSEELFREYLSHKAAASRISLIVSVVLYIVLVLLNKKGLGLAKITSPRISSNIVIIVFVAFLFGIVGLFTGIGEKNMTHNCQLEVEGNTVTFMQRTKGWDFSAQAGRFAMQGWHMEEVTSVEETKYYYIVYGNGAYVPDTRIISEQKKISKVKIPKWFSGMEALKALPENR